jgi:hypothetical protein
MNDIREIVGSSAVRRSGRRWRRFWLLAVPAVAAAGAVLVGVAQGALAASVAASGNAFKVSGDRLEGDGFTVMPGLNTEPGGKQHVVMVVTARRAELRNLCVSLLLPTPLGKMTVVVKAGTSRPVQATNLSVHADQAFGDIQLTQVDAQALSGAGASGNGLGGLTGSVSHLVAINPKFTGWRGTAGSFTLHDVSVLVKPGDHECF